ncbi:MAG: putative lipopolysaccharide heptosyltransferase III [Burkholderiales bacterium]|nr:putative lipopolysaccharide heptosyltransferase III [Burkholderiales bacterium]
MASPLPDPVPLHLLRRALVTKLRHHGDVLLASPVFTAMRNAAPALEIDALVYAETAPMLEGHPAIAQIHVIDRAWKTRGLATQLRGEWALLRTLRARGYDLLVHLTEHPRGLTLARLLRPRYAVTRERDKHARLWRRHFTHFYKLPRTERHVVEQNLDALRRIGIYPGEADRGLVLVPGPAAAKRVDEMLGHYGLSPREFVQVHPGSRWLFKCWPAERTAALVDLVVADGSPVVITGAPDDRERALTTAVLAAVQPATRARTIDLTGQLGLRELAALTARARAFAGVDSAPMHIAAAVGTPAVALFGPSSEVAWGPWQVRRRVVVSAHSCRPCGLDGCGGGKVSECITTLPVESVHAALASLLAETAH